MESKSPFRDRDSVYWKWAFAITMWTFCVGYVNRVESTEGASNGNDQAGELESANDEFPIVETVEPQPLLASLDRLVNAMEYVGSPLPASVVDEINSLSSSDNERETVARVQGLLDPLCLVALEVGEEGPPEVTLRAPQMPLIEKGWTTYLVKVVNRAGRNQRLLVESPNALPLPHSPSDQVAARWMQLSSFEGQPLSPNLSGLLLEYRLIQIYCHDAGTKHGVLEFAVGAKPGERGGVIREWRFDDGPDGWFEMHHSTIEVEDGSLHVTSTGNDPYIGAPVEAEPGSMIVRFWAHTDVEGMGQLFWWTTEKPFPDGQRRIDYVLATGREHLYEIEFQPEGNLAGIRIDPMSRTGEMRIDWIDLCTAVRAENWAQVPIEFESAAANRVTFQVTDEHGEPCIACFVIRDENGTIYPTPSKRLAPDFFFHQQIYRADGESIALPKGTYTVQCSRGPESVVEFKTVVVDDEPVTLDYQVSRWVDPSEYGWWSGDHHIHAAGCRHYENPTQGVHPEDMLRHIMGEDLKVGCCLTWGPCFDYQKQFFTGAISDLSQYPYLLRYDVEVSGFGSHMSGHLNLLNLSEQIYPGGDSKDHWPTLGLNTLRWAKKQGAVCGPAHSSLGLTNMIGRLPGTEGMDGPFGLPNYDLPAFDGIGANEFVMNVTHQVEGPNGEPVRAVDFISAMNTMRTAEWNMWYHVLNCGIKVAVSGETDFPCVSGERVGIGRVYAQVDGELTFEKWVQSIADGRSYVSDGRSHLMNFSAREKGQSDREWVQLGQDSSELQLDAESDVEVSVLASANISDVETTTVELIINGLPVDEQPLLADGSQQTLTFEATIDQSSWMAIRIFPSAHTNPIFVTVDGLPIRCSIDSARWCLAGVEQCWRSKQPTYAIEEQEDARDAYEHALEYYQQIVDEAGRRSE